MKIHEWLRELVPVLVSVASFVVSVAVLCATRSFNKWQTRLAQQKLRHDLYDRRFAIYMAFHELLVALVDKSDGEVRDSFPRCYVKLCEASFLLDDPQIEAYLKDLYKQVDDRVIRNIMFLQSSESAGTKAPQLCQEVAKRALELAAARADLATSHIQELPRQFARCLKLTDFWK
jgi:hypothetical protein